ncbi:UDP-N-acetylmuramoylalanine--D-glutamate ligase [Caldithrix abyssi DSM 13497]|uniref:UDP-N-acetylmuramoylalanine--D-glutamate ligase n=1 Tax=Caldithrix abyssi DSM 13497 TaxID=880073 RepID=H1XY47_CALAY|nr:UDP-N-acetylmuramoyl-L-alanine--D-glutamate ligase [Caldithrix abyssi]APF17917.1 murD UDP-N-acetylmuramoylalanine--D-glutamate ligase [Caldithrix abyssi DSM 13497]EHO41974.1 UDP-N-acetylmuramoylalanine--D-glutamate ligase [Caldithrix abyssi DSM 13497]
MKDLQNVKGKKVSVLGAARSGLAAARLLKNKGTHVFVSDRAPARQKQDALEFLTREQIDHEFGQHSPRVFEADFCVLSPGIPVASEVVQEVLKRNIPVLSEIEVASWFYEGRLIAVTGSNGKTTTTTLIGEMLRRRYPQAVVAGNIGQPFSDFADQSTNDAWGVVEVSSFQLETIDQFHPDQAVLLNYAPNHLDRYASYEEYMEAKWRITKNLQPDDRFIYNAADPEILKRLPRLSCLKSGFHIDGDEREEIYFKKGIIYLEGQPFINVDEMGLKGVHNYMNAMAAILAARYAGVSEVDIKAVLKSFTGVEHRLEFVRELNGVRFINDSKATTVESLYYALQSFKQPIILIAGGKDKGSDFSKLNEQIAGKVKAVILIGAATEKMQKAWQGIKPLYAEKTLEEAVQKAYELAKAGDVVLLSPACASFDMFKDFEDRGRQFKEIVRRLE